MPHPGKARVATMRSFPGARLPKPCITCLFQRGHVTGRNRDRRRSASALNPASRSARATHAAEVALRYRGRSSEETDGDAGRAAGPAARRGAEHGDAVLMRRAAGEGGADIVDRGGIGPGDDQRRPAGRRAACRRPARSASSAATKRSRSPATSACITGCSGAWVCSSARPGRSCAAGAAGDLVEQLVGALGGAQVAAVQAEIGVDHARPA